MFAFLLKSKGYASLHLWHSFHHCFFKILHRPNPYILLIKEVVADFAKLKYSPQVYYQLEKLSSADPPYKSVAALNCIILGCGNIWDIERAYQTFDAIGSSFGLTPDIHSYNALMYAFGKLKKVCIYYLSPLYVNTLAISKSAPVHVDACISFS